MRRNGKAKASLKARNKSPLAEKAVWAGLMQSISHPEINRNLIRKYKTVCAGLEKALAAASPNSKVDLISGIAVDLADFWEIAVEHQRRVGELTKMRFPKDQERFVDMLYELEIRLLIHADWHVRQLRPRLASIKRDLRLT